MDKKNPLPDYTCTSHDKLSPNYSISASCLIPISEDKTIYHVHEKIPSKSRILVVCRSICTIQFSDTEEASRSRQRGGAGEP